MPVYAHVSMINGDDGKKLSKRHGAVSVMQYRDAESVEKREKMALARKLNALTMPHPDRRPDKKERRDLLRFKHGDSE